MPSHAPLPSLPNLLWLPQPEWLPSARASDAGPALGLPSAEAQRQRLGKTFGQLAGLLSQLRSLRSGAPASVVLVLQTAGSAEAIRSLADSDDELEWLGEWPTELEPSDAFFLADDPEAPVPGQQYHLLLSPKGLYAFIARWERFVAQKPARPDRRWLPMFEHLHSLWPWGAQQRHAGTGFWEAWEDALAEGHAWYPFEIELWYRPSKVYRQLAAREVERLLHAWGGHLEGPGFELEPIGYHGLLARLPTTAIRKLQNSPTSGLFLCPYIKHLRPTGTLRARTTKDAPPEAADARTANLPNSHSHVALLDGLPQANHPMLAGWLRFGPTDEPPADAYPLVFRQHGTQLASLLVHGDLNLANAPLASPVWVQPVLSAAPDDWAAPTRTERSPPQLLPVKVVYDAVWNLLHAHPNGNFPRVLVLGVNDAYANFDDQMTPLARLLDWLSFKFRLLFIVPAGQFETAFSLDLRPEELYALQGAPHKLQQATLERLYHQAAERRIAAPAEAVNALTVGASHRDGSPLEAPGYRYDLLQQAALGSPLSRQGPGYLNAVKPDLLFPGGRQLFTDQFYVATQRALLTASQSTGGRVQPPGLKVAAPGTDGKAGALSFACGPDKAAALAGRMGARILERLPPELQPLHALLAKCLLAHCATRQAEVAWLKRLVDENEAAGPLRNWMNAYLGFGNVDPEVLPGTAPGTATLLWAGTLRPEHAAKFDVPLPRCLLVQALRRQLTLSLAWHSPIEPRGGPYRIARMWCELPVRNTLNLRLAHPDRQPLRRGTLWHETYESVGAIRQPEDAEPPVLALQVNCKAAHRSLPVSEAIPFALALTFQAEPLLELADAFKSAGESIR